VEVNGKYPDRVRPRVSVQPDNFMETLLYLLSWPPSRPMIPLDEALRPTWLFGATVHEGCDRGGYYEQEEFADEYGSKLCIVIGMLGSVVQCNVGKRGWMGGSAGVRISGVFASDAPCPVFQINHAFYGPASGFTSVIQCGNDLWQGDPRVTQVYASFAKQKNQVRRKASSRRLTLGIRQKFLEVGNGTRWKQELIPNRPT